MLFDEKGGTSPTNIPHNEDLCKNGYLNAQRQESCGRICYCHVRFAVPAYSRLAYGTKPQLSGGTEESKDTRRNS